MSSIPTLAEVPLLKEGMRDWEDLLRIAMIPAEDAALRAAAVSLHNKSEKSGTESLVDDLGKLSDVPAKTPGGLAWKLAMALRYFQEDEGDWNWASYLLQSALTDALEHERARMAGDTP
jgi:hypothetical protein